MAQLTSLGMIVCDWQHPRKIGHNTYAWHDSDHNFSVKYHKTYVVFYDASTKELYVTTNGWFTKTTAERIHHALHQLSLSLSTTDLPGRWRVMDYNGNAFTIRGHNLRLKNVNGQWHRV